MFQHAAARRRLGFLPLVAARINFVSTRSRPKAAGSLFTWRVIKWGCFNTQPPEGGWAAAKTFALVIRVSTRSRPTLRSWTGCLSFNTQPPEGGWVHADYGNDAALAWVSTRSRPKAAGAGTGRPYPLITGFNTQPPEGGWDDCNSDNVFRSGFNTQPPEGGWAEVYRQGNRAGRFQHAAARRRLG